MKNWLIHFDPVSPLIIFPGGVRASIYNAMPEEHVDRLIAYIQEFAKEHGSAA